MVRISVCRADLNPIECKRYVDGHRKVLEAYGVTQVTSANLDWMNEPYTYLVTVASTETGETLGGARIQVAGGSVPLPIETAIDDMDPRIYERVKEEAQRGTGEYCGLWNSRKIAGYGIGSVVLVRVGIAVMSQLRLNSLFAFCSPATVPISTKVGYQIITSLGNNGTFYYPKEDLLATALILKDPLELKHAAPKEREAIFDLTNNLVQESVEHGRRGKMKIEYDLRIIENVVPKI